MQKRNQVLSFLVSLSIITYIDRTCISLVASDMKADLKIENYAWGWILSAFALCIDIGKSKSGLVSGAMNMVGQMGAVFLGVLFGYIVKATDNFNYPLYMIDFLLFCGCLLWFIIDPEKEIDFD